MGTIYRGQEDYSFSLSENEIRSDQQVVLLTEAKGALFQENKIFAGTQIWSSSSVTFNQNTIKADHRDDILLTKENTDITLENNNLQVDSDMDCI